MTWSLVLAAVGVLGLYVAGRKHWAGWAIGCGAQVLWVVYAVVTKQYGFLISAFAYFLVYANNLVRWTKTSPEPTEPEVSCPSCGATIRARMGEQ